MAAKFAMLRFRCFISYVFIPPVLPT